jgi:hypothetical protein
MRVFMGLLVGVTLSACTMPADRFTSEVSDNQDFAAVSARNTREGDAAHLENLQASYQQNASIVAAVPVPERPRTQNVSVVDYALSSTNDVGVSLYARSGLPNFKRSQRKCARYPSLNLAQEAFLKAGGPHRDKLGIDPDGDGFACAWTPAPFRKARAVVESPEIVETGVTKADLDALGIKTESLSDSSSSAPSQ